MRMKRVKPHGNVAQAVNKRGQRINVLFDVAGSSAGQVKGGRVRALATTAANRSPVFPDVPTLSESGLPGYEFETWFGLFVPSAVPEPVRARIERAALARRRDDPKPDAGIAGIVTAAKINVTAHDVMMIPRPGMPPPNRSSIRASRRRSASARPPASGWRGRSSAPSPTSCRPTASSPRRPT